MIENWYLKVATLEVGEKPIAAAFRDMETGSVSTGVTHYFAYLSAYDKYQSKGGGLSFGDWYHNQLDMADDEDHGDGFVTDKGRFIDRHEALMLSNLKLKNNRQWLDSTDLVREKLNG